MSKRSNALLDPFLIGVYQQFQAERPGLLITEGDHLTKLPGSIDMQKWERWLSGIKRLHSQVQHHGRILANRVQHYRIVELGCDLTNEVDAFRLQLLKVGHLPVNL